MQPGQLVHTHDTSTSVINTVDMTCFRMCFYLSCVCSVLDVPPQPAAPAFQDDDDIYESLPQVSMGVMWLPDFPVLRVTCYASTLYLNCAPLYALTILSLLFSCKNFFCLIACGSSPPQCVLLSLVTLQGDEGDYPDALQSPMPSLPPPNPRFPPPSQPAPPPPPAGTHTHTLCVTRPQQSV